MDDENLNHLISKIEEGKIPLHLLLNRLFESVIALNNKIDQLDKKLEPFSQLAYLSIQSV